MGKDCIIWTTEIVTSRIIEAARIAHRLPPVRVQGYFNLWPTFVRTEYERMVCDDAPIYRFPPSPADIDRMLAVMHWIQCLEIEQRKLVWMRAERWKWCDIAKRFGVAPRTVQRRWDAAIQAVTEHVSRSD